MGAYFPGSDSRRGRIRVLLVDDSPALSAALALLLSQDDRIEVVGMAEDGAQALEWARLAAPDVIVTDLEMPIMHGADFVRAQMSRLPIPIIVYSGLEATAPLAQLALSAGAVACLRKPIHHGEIQAQQALLQRAILSAWPLSA